jgi:membrane protease YdiL (CAAX protease family)
MSRFVPEGKVSLRVEILLEAFFTIGAFGPTIAARTLNWLAHRNFSICGLWTGWRSLIAGLAFGLTTFSLVALVLPTYAIVKAPLSAWHWSSLLHWRTYAVNDSTFFGGPVNEEPGWRGFALPRLQARYGPMQATMILAALWAGWHLPLFWVPGWTTATPWEFLLILAGISFLFTAAANLAKFNVLVPIVLHAFFNTSSLLGNTLSHNLLPRRPHEMLIYTLVVFVFGAGIGTAGLSMCAALRKEREIGASGELSQDS